MRRLAPLALLLVLVACEPAEKRAEAQDQRALALLAAPVAAQELVTGISTENIALTANFTGSEVLVFGAIRRDAPIPRWSSRITA